MALWLTRVKVIEFVKLAHHLQWKYFYPKIESNRGVQLAQYVAGAYANNELRELGYDLEDESRLQLEGHFPFDPCLLPQVCVFFVVTGAPRRRRRRMGEFANPFSHRVSNGFKGIT